MDSREWIRSVSGSILMFAVDYVLLILLLSLGGCGGNGGEVDNVDEVDNGEVLASFLLDDNPATDVEDGILPENGRKWCEQTLKCFVNKGIITPEEAAMINLDEVEIKLVTNMSSYKNGTLYINHDSYSEQKAFVTRHEFTHYIGDKLGIDEHELFDFKGEQHWHSKCQANELYF